MNCLLDMIRLRKKKRSKSIKVGIVKAQFSFTRLYFFRVEGVDLAQRQQQHRQYWISVCVMCSETNYIEHTNTGLSKAISFSFLAILKQLVSI